MPNFNLDKFKLPDDDATKPAEITPDADDATRDLETPDAAAAAKAQADKETVDQKTDETSTEDPKSGESKPADDSKPQDTQATDESKLTPFHEHPDWKKMQEEKRELELQLAEMKGQVSTLLSSSKTTTEEKQDAIKTAEERIQDDLKNGWEPKDQLELSLRVARYAKEELKAEAQAAKDAADKQNEKQQETASKLQERADAIFKDNGITDAKDRQLIDETANEWLKKGMVNSIEGLSVVIDYLKAKGQLGAAAATTIAADETASAEKDKRNDVNSKISKPSSSTPSDDKSTKIQLQFKRKPTLDDIVLQGGKALG